MAVSVLTSEPSVLERLAQTFGEETEQVIEQVESSSNPDRTLEELLQGVDGHKLAGAHLAVDTSLHWAYAFISAGAFLGLLIFLANKGASPLTLLTYGIITGTVGIILLLGFQWVAFATQGFWVRGRGIVILLFYIVKFIGFSYTCALNPDNGFMMSFLGFTCGVGLCGRVMQGDPGFVLSQRH